MASYISFPPGTLGHLPDMDVEVRLVRTQIGATSPAASRSSVGREPLKSTAGRRTVTGSLSWRIRSSSCDHNEQARVIAISMQGAKQWKDSGA